MKAASRLLHSASDVVASPIASSVALPQRSLEHIDVGEPGRGEPGGAVDPYGQRGVCAVEAVSSASISVSMSLLKSSRSGTTSGHATSPNARRRR